MPRSCTAFGLCLILDFVLVDYSSLSLSASQSKPLKLLLHDSIDTFPSLLVIYFRYIISIYLFLLISILSYFHAQFSGRVFFFLFTSPWQV